MQRVISRCGFSTLAGSTDSIVQLCKPIAATNIYICECRPTVGRSSSTRARCNVRPLPVQDSLSMKGLAPSFTPRTTEFRYNATFRDELAAVANRTGTWSEAVVVEHRPPRQPKTTVHPTALLMAAAVALLMEATITATATAMGAHPMVAPLTAKETAMDHPRMETATALVLPPLQSQNKHHPMLLVVGVAHAPRVRKAASGEWMLTRTCPMTRYAPKPTPTYSFTTSPILQFVRLCIVFTSVHALSSVPWHILTANGPVARLYSHTPFNRSI